MVHAGKGNFRETESPSRDVVPLVRHPDAPVSDASLRRIEALGCFLLLKNMNTASKFFQFMNKPTDATTNKGFKQNLCNSHPGYIN